MSVNHKVSDLMLNIATNQYSIQWTRLGNLQSSSGILFTFVSLIEALVIAVVSQNFENLKVLENKIFVSAFYILFFSSLLFMVLACIFMVLILRSKTFAGISNPVELQDELDAVGEQNQSLNEDDLNKLINDLLIAKVNAEIEEIDGILSKNRKNYSKCLISSVCSFICSFSSLMFVCSSVFSGFQPDIIIPALLCGLVFIGLFFILFFQRGNFMNEEIFNAIYNGSELKRDFEQGLEDVSNAVMKLKNDSQTVANNPYLNKISISDAEKIKQKARYLFATKNPNTKIKAVESYIQSLDLETDEKNSLKLLLEARGI